MSSLTAGYAPVIRMCADFSFWFGKKIWLTSEFELFCYTEESLNSSSNVFKTINMTSGFCWTTHWLGRILSLFLVLYTYKPSTENEYKQNSNPKIRNTKIRNEKNQQKKWKKNFDTKKQNRKWFMNWSLFKWTVNCVGQRSQSVVFQCC